jgi:hypothetical protein
MKKSNHISTALLAAGALFVASSSANAVLLQGNPFVPAGADFQIFALQGIDSSTPTGKTGFSPQVNRDFEFAGATGVSYDRGNGQLTDFGLGLYFNAQQQVQSTGLNIQFNGLVNASSVNITVEDFDIKLGATFFNPQKVEPGILILGPNKTVIASASPTDIFANLTPNSTNSGGKKGGGDVWDINLGQLLTTLKMSDTAISGYILYADATAGERPNSDPYLLVSAGNGIVVVPEFGNYIAGLAAIAFAGLFHVRQLQLRRKASQVKIS